MALAEGTIGPFCRCGCEGTTRGGTWLPGHDARYRSSLVAAIRTGEPDSSARAHQEMLSLGWERFIPVESPEEYEDGIGPPGIMTWRLMYSILCHHHRFLSLFEDEGIEEMEINGMTINVHDILKNINRLPERQRQAVTLICIEDMREVDAARIMLPGSKWSSPVGVYKRVGLKKLVDWYNQEQEIEKEKRWQALRDSRKPRLTERQLAEREARWASFLQNRQVAV